MQMTCNAIPKRFCLLRNILFAHIDSMQFLFNSIHVLFCLCSDIICVKTEMLHTPSVKTSLSVLIPFILSLCPGKATEEPRYTQSSLV